MQKDNKFGSQLCFSVLFRQPKNSFNGTDVTKHKRGWAGNCKNVPGVACSVEGGKAVVSIHRVGSS